MYCPCREPVRTSRFCFVLCSPPSKLYYIYILVLQLPDIESYSEIWYHECMYVPNCVLLCTIFNSVGSNIFILTHTCFSAYIAYTLWHYKPVIFNTYLYFLVHGKHVYHSSFSQFKYFYFALYSSHCPISKSMILNPIL